MKLRSFGTLSRHLAGKVFPELKTPLEVAAFVNTSHGSLQDLMPKPGKHVDASTVHKMLQLSGFDTEISAEVENKWTQALNTQVGFINHLDGVATKTNASVFRPINSDHSAQKPLTLEALNKLVEESRDLEEEDFDSRTYIKDTIKL